MCVYCNVTPYVVLLLIFCFFFKHTATTEIYTYGHTLSLHDALPIWPTIARCAGAGSASMRRARSNRLPRRPPGSGWLTENFRFAAIQCYKTGLGTGRSVVVDTVLRGRIGFVGRDWPEWDEQQAGSAARTDDGGDSDRKSVV